eukprot:253358-Pyramimonas_sp.AAC.1
MRPFCVASLHEQGVRAPPSETTTAVQTQGRAKHSGSSGSSSGCCSSPPLQSTLVVGRRS